MIIFLHVGVFQQQWRKEQRKEQKKEKTKHSLNMKRDRVHWFPPNNIWQQGTIILSYLSQQIPEVVLLMDDFVEMDAISEHHLAYCDVLVYKCLSTTEKEQRKNRENKERTKSLFTSFHFQSCPGIGGDDRWCSIFHLVQPMYNNW